MSKVKIVQIAVAANETKLIENYLDDKGRVWYQVRERNKETREYEWVWKQVNLPEDPEEIDVPF